MVHMGRLSPRKERNLPKFETGISRMVLEEDPTSPTAPFYSVEKLSHSGSTQMLSSPKALPCHPVLRMCLYCQLAENPLLDGVSSVHSSWKLWADGFVGLSVVHSPQPLAQGSHSVDFC